MSHKLQTFSSRNDGKNSVAQSERLTSKSKTGSNDAGLRQVPVPRQRASKTVSTEIPQGEAKAKAPRRAASQEHAEIDTGLTRSLPGTVLTDALAEYDPTPGQTGQVPRGAPAPRRGDRCDVARSAGYDPTGERAFACGAVATVICEYCGPMCSSCAEETFCYYGEHKLTRLPDDGPLPPAPQWRGPISEVVYLELNCPKRHRVRLALPRNHRPQSVRRCPVCRRKARAEYLAHGFTRRKLPYYEVFKAPEATQITLHLDGTNRIPWDNRTRGGPQED